MDKFKIRSFCEIAKLCTKATLKCELLNLGEKEEFPGNQLKAMGVKTPTNHKAVLHAMHV